MARNIDIDTKSVLDRLSELDKTIKIAQKKAVNGVADEILRLSNFEVPHDKGLLQTSGHVEPQEDEAIVGYNKVYAARLHEHPEYNFNKGRKGKYLEDPIKNNISVFRNFIQGVINQALA